MLYRTSEGLKLSDLKVKYKRNEKEFEQFVGEEGDEWWNEFSEKWDHTEIIRFTNVEYSEEQLARYEEVKDLAISETILEEYINSGLIGEGLEILSLRKENENLKQLLADLSEIVLLGGM